MPRVFSAPNLHKNLCAVFSVIPPFQMEKLMLSCCHLGSYVLAVIGSPGVACPLGTVCAAGLTSGDPEPSTSQPFCPPDLPCFEARDLPGARGWPQVSGRGPVAAFLHGGLRIQLQPLSLQMGKPSHKWWQDLPSFPLAQAWCPWQHPHSW